MLSILSCQIVFHSEVVLVVDVVGVLAEKFKIGVKFGLPCGKKRLVLHCLISIEKNISSLFKIYDR